MIKSQEVKTFKMTNVELEKLFSEHFEKEFKILNTSLVKLWAFDLNDSEDYTNTWLTPREAEFCESTLEKYDVLNMSHMEEFLKYLKFKGILESGYYIIEFLGHKYGVHPESLQYKLDEVMLEYCPDEMSKEQINNWQLSQKKVD